MNLKRTFSTLLIIFCAFFSIGLLPGNTVSEKITTALKKYTDEFPQEKAYLHTDRPYYLAGETIWFKAYVTAGSFNQLSPISKTLYIELIDEKKEVITQRMIRLPEGTGHGDILLPSNLKSGNYLLRAYTNWMRNFDDNFFYTEEIKVWNLDEQQSTTQLPDTEAIDLQFFPEGGHLVDRLKNNLAFKALGKDGMSRSVKGKIFSSKGEVAEFETSHQGMGVISMTPEKDETYVAEIDGMNTKKYPLPKVEPQGMLITVTNKSDLQDVVVKIQLSESLPRPQVITLVAHQRGELSFMAQATMANVIFFIKIPKAKLVGGLTHITLFDSSGKPLCDRLIFIENSENLQVNITGLKNKYHPREKVEFEIEIKDRNGNPAVADLSLAALNTNEVALDQHRKTIENYLFLQSDIRGNIESPGYYFDTSIPDRAAKLDLLLLTQGWSRFSWPKILNDEWPTAPHYIEQGVNIQGQLVDEFNGNPIEGGKVTFFTTDNQSEIVVAATGKEGRFIFDDLVFYDSSQVVLQGENKKGKKIVKFNLDPILPKQAIHYKLAPLTNELTSFERALITKGVERRKIEAAYNFDEKVRVLDAVEIKGEKIDPEKEARVYQGASKTVKAENVPGSAFLWHPLELLRGVPGVQLTPNPPGYSVIVRGVGTISAGTEPLVLLDNVPIALNSLNAYPASMFESVDVFKGADAAIFGSQGANGVIAFFSKKGGSQNALTPGIYNYSINGYNAPQEFYSPAYKVANPEHVKPDRRVTVYWNPTIVTNEQGKAKVTFYNHDPESIIQLQVEGMTKTGLVGIGSAKYETKSEQ
jgi:hypothetical protein